MTTDTKTLRELAEAATPGGWRIHDRSSTTVIGGKIGHAIAACGQHADNTRDGESLFLELQGNAAFIAAANPETVIGLLDEVERLREALEHERNAIFYAMTRGQDYDIGLAKERMTAALKPRPAQTEEKNREISGN